VRGVSVPAWRLLGCVLLSTPLGLSYAGSLGVGPTLIELTSQKPVAVLSVRNTGDKPAIVQLETVAWSQDDGSDQYLPTEEIAATPEVFELAPGVQREVRVGLRSRTTTERERSFRVYVREVQPQTGKEEPQLSFAVRIGVPVFASTAARKEEPSLSWQLLPQTSGCPRVSVHNAASHRQRLSRLELLAGDTVLWDEGTSAYVLAGATRTFAMASCESVNSARELRVTAESRTVTLPTSN
jgi:fimbrial chaperone protein